MFKRGLLRIAGVVAYVAPPIAYLATKYQLFISKEASVTLSAYGVLAIIPILSLLGYYLKRYRSKYRCSDCLCASSELWVCISEKCWRGLAG